MNAEEIYRPLGVSPQVCAFGERVLDGLRERFAAVDRIAEANQAKVLAAMQKNRVSAACFAATTGYGYDDVGRDKLERVYADTFHTEAALVRPQITCGTHALTVALSANLLPGDELLSPVGAPYDTLEEVIGIRPSPCSLREYGVSYRQADLKPDGTFDFAADKDVSFEQLITILSRLCATDDELAAAGSDLSAFADGYLASIWSRGAFAWAADKGLVQGYDEPAGKYLRPGENVARERVAVVLMRAFEMGIMK